MGIFKKREQKTPEQTIEEFKQKQEKIEKKEKLTFFEKRKYKFIIKQIQKITNKEDKNRRKLNLKEEEWRKRYITAILEMGKVLEITEKVETKEGKIIEIEVDQEFLESQTTEYLEKVMKASTDEMMKIVGES